MPAPSLLAAVGGFQLGDRLVDLDPLVLDLEETLFTPMASQL
jgi:hypothetical protein